MCRDLSAHAHRMDPWGIGFPRTQLPAGRVLCSLHRLLVLITAFGPRHEIHDHVHRKAIRSIPNPSQACDHHQLHARLVSRLLTGRLIRFASTHKYASTPYGWMRYDKPRPIELSETSTIHFAACSTTAYHYPLLWASNVLTASSCYRALSLSISS